MTNQVTQTCEEIAKALMLTAELLRDHEVPEKVIFETIIGITRAFWLVLQCEPGSFGREELLLALQKAYA